MYVLVVRQVSGAALDDSARRVKVDPQQEAKVRPLEVVRNVRVVDRVQEITYREDSLTDGLNKPILSLEVKKLKFLKPNWHSTAI